MRFIACALAGMIMLGFAGGCKKKPDVNKVDLDQIDVDDSNNYRYIFKDIIQEQKERQKKIEKKEF